MAIKVLGIDPGSHVTGYGLVERGSSAKLSIVCSGIIKTGQGAPLHERLSVIFDEVTAVIQSHALDAVAVESVFTGRNSKSALTLGHARGVILLGAARAGLEVFEYAPTKVKQAVTGYGSAEKGQVQRMVKALLSTATLPRPDEADALAVAICHLNHLPGRAQAVRGAVATGGGVEKGSGPNGTVKLPGPGRKRTINP